MGKVFEVGMAASAARKSRAAARDIGKACAGLLRVAAGRLAMRHAPARKESRPVPQPADREPPAARDHMGKLSTVVDAACRHGERAQALHESAGRRIDAALYELEQLRQELEAVVDPQLLKRTSEILQNANAPSLQRPSAVTADPATAKRSAA